MNSTINVSKIKRLVSCAVTAPLFSHRQKSGFLMTRPIRNSCVIQPEYDA